MPIYEFACPKCRVIFSFLSQRVNPDRLPVCPRCGSRKMARELSRFAMLRGAPEPAPAGGAPGAEPGGNDPRLLRAMRELERDMEHLDENNPRHMAHVMRKMKEALPSGSAPKELDVAIRRLEAGEDPEKIEADMGDVLDDFMGGDMAGPAAGAYTRDTGLHDY